MKKESVFFMPVALVATLILGIGLAQAQQNKPHVEIKVNKEYDKKGNVIRYDSTYVYTYSNTGGNIEQWPDSIFFPKILGFDFADVLNPLHFAPNDSTTSSLDLFNDPFFSSSLNEMEEIMKQMEERTRRFDSIFRHQIEMQQLEKKKKQYEQHKRKTTDI